MRDSAEECRKCLIPTYVSGIPRGDFCHVCKEHRDDKKLKNLYRKNWEKTINKIKGRPYKYHCLLGLSGGKDSAYLAYILSRKYKLRVLAVTIDNGFLPPAAIENIKRTIEILGLDSLYYQDDGLRKILRQKFLERGQSLENRLCKVCFRSKYEEFIRIAARENIPLIVTGFVIDQGDAFYELPRREINDICRGIEINTKSSRPRILFPLHVMPALSPSFIGKRVMEERLIKEIDPVDTNCYLSRLFVYYDMINHGFCRSVIISTGGTSRYKNVSLPAFLKIKLIEIMIAIRFRKKAFLPMSMLGLSNPLVLKKRKIIRFLINKLHESFRRILRF